MKGYSLSLLWLCSLCLAFSSCHHKKDNNVIQVSYRHPYGANLDQKEWVNRGGNGTIETILKTGEKIIQAFTANQLHGITTVTFADNKTIEKEQTYDKGLLKEETVFYLNGLPKTRIEFLGGLGKKITSWYEESSPKSIEVFQDSFLEEGQYFSLDNQVESEVFNGQGIRTLRNTLGLLIAQDLIEEGHLSQKTTFYSNGDPQSIIAYHKGLIHGKKQNFLIGGIPSSVEEWSMGKLDGLVIIFHNGEKFKEIPYQKGNKEGISRRFKEGNIVIEESSWKGDLRHGPTHTYIGDNIKTEWFFRGEQVSKQYFEEISIPH